MPYEQGYREQFKDSRTLPPDNRVYAERQQVPLPPHLEWIRCVFEEMKDQMKLLMISLFYHSLIHVKSPADLERPYYFEPRVMMVEATIPVGSSFTEVMSVPVPARHSIMLVAIGIDEDSPVAVANRAVEFYYDFNGAIVDKIDDNSAAPAPGCPAAPVLQVPVNGASFPERAFPPFTFEWMQPDLPLGQPLTYRIQITLSTDPTFAAPVVDITQPPVVQAGAGQVFFQNVIASSLPANDYIWRVIVTDSFG